MNDWTGSCDPAFRAGADAFADTGLPFGCVAGHMSGAVGSLARRADEAAL